MLKANNAYQIILENYIDKVVNLDHAAGIAMAVVDGNGHTLYEKYVGSRDIDRQLPIDEDTVFGLASVTKSFTALAVMQLAERGLLHTEDPVSRHIPEFAHKNIRISHLLSHSAGFYPMRRKTILEIAETYHLSPEKDGDLIYNKDLFSHSACRQIDEMNNVTSFIGEPGEYFSYSNDSYALLSELVRRVGREDTYAAYLDKNILQPLQMNRSGCKYNWQNDDNVSRLYVRDGNAYRSDLNFYDEAPALPGAGAMKSTIRDMKKYLHMYLNSGRITDDKRFMQTRNINQMVVPRQTCDLNKYYGFGLKIKQLGDFCVMEHGGDDPGVSANIAWSYETGIGVVVLCNTSQVTVRTISDMTMLFAANQDPSEVEREPDRVEWSQEKCRKVCGTYQTDEGTTVVIDWMGDCFSVNLDGANTVAFPINRYMLRVKGTVADQTARIYVNEEGTVWAIGGGYRILPKIA